MATGLPPKLNISLNVFSCEKILWIRNNKTCVEHFKIVHWPFGNIESDEEFFIYCSFIDSKTYNFYLKMKINAFISSRINTMKKIHQKLIIALYLFCFIDSQTYNFYWKLKSMHSSHRRSTLWKRYTKNWLLHYRKSWVFWDYTDKQWLNNLICRRYDLLVIFILFFRIFKSALFCDFC